MHVDARSQSSNRLSVRTICRSPQDDPQWPVLFEELRVKFSELLGNMVSAIEHVGSTSVPGIGSQTYCRFGCFACLSKI